MHTQTPLVLLILFLSGSARLRGETGYDAWLRYPAIKDSSTLHRYAELPRVVVLAGDSEILNAAETELARGLRGMLVQEVRIVRQPPTGDAFVLGAWNDVKRLLPELPTPPSLAQDGFWLRRVTRNQAALFVITAPTAQGVLYGTFAFLRKLALQESIASLDVHQSPYAPIRYLNHWDNLSGTIERGYAGKSIFWDNDHLTPDLARVSDYGRLLASVGINGCSLNNVNADARLLTPDFLSQVAKLAGAFRPWGVRVLLSVDFASPKKIGGLDTFDPLDPRVVEFWDAKVEEVYRFVPDLAGFILKADSEGRLGPSAYGRTHADAANLIAKPLKAHDGLLFYRGFVYDHHMDWRDLKLDRAKAAFDNFHSLDGKFDDNVIVQIKHGPIDFQVREPASPLLGGLKSTSQAIELQITQEYTGQQRHLCYLVPMWKEALDFDLQASGPGTPVKALVAGKTFNRSTGGFVGVSNVGRDTNWLAHPLAMVNLYGFGRLAWDPDLTSKAIAEEWARLSFSHDRRVYQTIVDLELKSWPAYENYTGPLGAGTLTDIIGVHFGPAVESSERNGWGQWHRADEQGVGMDRTVATGTGFIGQYSPPVAANFESLQTCPDNLLLFMHHVPYTHVLHSGQSVIQHVYDSHYAGAAQAALFVEQWSRLRGHLDEERFQDVLKRLTYQAGHAVVWRDAINNWFLRKSGIADRQGRAGRFPNRVEAENLDLNGYSIMDVKPWETASGGRAIQIAQPGGHGSASLRFPGKPGKYDLNVQYLDENDGASVFKLSVDGREVARWIADDLLPSNHPDGHTSTRRTFRNISLVRGAEIQIEGTAQGSEQACIDYLEIIPSTRPKSP